MLRAAGRGVAAELELARLDLDPEEALESGGGGSFQSRISEKLSWKGPPCPGNFVIRFAPSTPAA